MAQDLTVYLIKDFIESTLDLSGQILGSVFDGTNTVLTVCNLFNLRAGMVVQVDSLPYTVLSVSHANETFTVVGDLTGTFLYEVPNPFYFWGTPMQGQTEISNTAPVDKYPFVFLAELMRERNPGEFSPIVRESDVRLFFLDEMNKQDWHTRELYSEVLIGLNKLVNAFISQLRASAQFYTEQTTFERSNRSDFGLQFATNTGSVQALFADNLSCVELSFTLSVRRCCACLNSNC